jgi:hypothetical protein
MRVHGSLVYTRVAGIPTVRIVALYTGDLKTLKGFVHSPDSRREDTQPLL